MIGRQFGKLKVVSLAGEGPRGSSWNCKCSCGNAIRLSTFQLTKGSYGSCGCNKNWSDKVQPTPRHLREDHPLTYSSWKGMLVRCHYTKEKQNCYRGIDIEESWFSFENFLRDMGPRPSINHSLDREKPTENYCKGNCRWVTKHENSSNIRRNVSPERNKRVSEGLKKAHAEGRIQISEETRKAISRGAKKRIGRKLQLCAKCGGKSYTKLCQRCRGKRPKVAS